MSTATRTLTDADLTGLIETHYGDGAADVLATIRRWVARGDGAAIYENADFSDAALGELRIVSYGSPAAQLETELPPTTLPDIGGAINWRYQLKAVHAGPAAS